MGSTPFAELADLGQQLEQTSKRLEMAALLAGFLRRLAADEIPPAGRLMIGQVFPEWDERVLNISGQAVSRVVDGLTDASSVAQEEIAAQAIDGGERVRMLLERARRQSPQPPPLTILDVFRTLEEIATATGKGSRGRKETLLQGLLSRATPIEAKFLVKVIYQDMRHGVNEGIMLDAIARAAGIKPKLVRRAHQFWGDLGKVALVGLIKGGAGLKEAAPGVFRPLKPMLAQTAEGLAEAFEHFKGRLALEYKLDGARVQIHRRGDEVRIFSRRLTDVTASLPDVGEEIRKR